MEKKTPNQEVGRLYVSVIQVIHSVACPYALGHELTLCGYFGSVVGMIRF